MHYTVGTVDSSSSPSFTLPAAPPTPTRPARSITTPSTDQGSSIQAPRSNSARSSTSGTARSFPNAPSHPNPAFASVLKRDAALAERGCSAAAASIAGPSTQPETALAAAATVGSAAESPVRLVGGSSQRDLFQGRRSEAEEEEEEAPYTFSERIRESMADNSAVISTFIAGGLAGAASRTVVSPLERLKIIL